jgi:hypothetical protein
MGREAIRGVGGRISQGMVFAPNDAQGKGQRVGTFVANRLKLPTGVVSNIQDKINNGLAGMDNFGNVVEMVDGKPTGKLLQSAEDRQREQSGPTRQEARRERQQERRGDTTIHAMDENGQTTKEVVGSADRVTRKVTNNTGQEIGEWNPDTGIATDFQGNQIGRSYRAGDVTKRVVNAAGKAVNWTVDAAGRAIDAAGRVIGRVADSAGTILNAAGNVVGSVSNTVMGAYGGGQGFSARGMAQGALQDTGINQVTADARGGARDIANQTQRTAAGARGNALAVAEEAANVGAGQLQQEQQTPEAAKQARILTIRQSNGNVLRNFLITNYRDADSARAEVEEAGLQWNPVWNNIPYQGTISDANLKQVFMDDDYDFEDEDLGLSHRRTF